MDNKIAVKTILVTLGAAFVLLSVNEWKKLADQVPNDDSNTAYMPVPSADMPYNVSCRAVGVAKTIPGAGSLTDCQNAFGTNVPWTQGIKAFVYSWIGVGLLVAAFIKPRASGVSGGYW